MIIDQHNLQEIKAVLAKAGLDPVEAEYFQHRLKSLRPTRRHLDGQEVVKIQSHYFTCAMYGDQVKVSHDGPCNLFGDYMVG